MARLIYADKLRKDVLDLPDCYNGFSDTYDKARILDLVDEQPTVDAEPVRHGRWQVNEVDGYKDMTCLSCGWLFEYYDGLEEEWNYCPHCGAKMDEVENAKTD